jgi:hypothetical protein
VSEENRRGTLGQWDSVTLPWQIHFYACASLILLTALVEAKGAYPCSQEPAIRAYFSQLNPVYIVTNTFFNINLKIILQTGVWFSGGRFFFLHRVQTRSGAQPVPIQWIPVCFFLGSKSAGAWSYTSTPPYVFMAWCLAKHRDNFTFTLCLGLPCGVFPSLSRTKFFMHFSAPHACYMPPIPSFFA